MSFSKFILNEGFKEFITKYGDDGELSFFIDKFKFLKTRNKITGVEADIDYWIKKPLSEFKKMVNSFDDESVKSSNEIKKEATSNIVAENDDYFIYEIKSAEEAYALGRGTHWCVASGSKKDASEMWKYYTNGFGGPSVFYFAIKKKLGKIQLLKSRGADDDGKANLYPYWDKIAIQVKYNSVSYWDSGDHEHKDSSLMLGDGVVLPKFEMKRPEVLFPCSEIDGDGVYNITGDLILEERHFDGTGSLVVKIDSVDGNVVCGNLESIGNLKNFPTNIKGSLKVYGCENIESLISPIRKIGSNILINKCRSLRDISLDVYNVKDVYIGNCPSLRTLKHLPSVCNDVHVEKCEALETLSGIDNANSIVVEDCPSLRSLIGTKKIHGTIAAHRTNITTLSGIPSETLDSLSLIGNHNLKDVSDFPIDVDFVDIHDCPNIDWNTLPEDLDVKTKDKLKRFVGESLQPNHIKYLKMMRG